MWHEATVASFVYHVGSYLEKKKKTVENLGQTLLRLGFENVIPNYETLQLITANGFTGLRIVSSGGLLRIRT
jgi:hypothetical protein